MAPLRCAAKFDPFLSLDCARVEGMGAQSKERKGSNFAIWQHWWAPAHPADPDPLQKCEKREIQTTDMCALSRSLTHSQLGYSPSPSLSYVHTTKSHTHFGDGLGLPLTPLECIWSIKLWQKIFDLSHFPKHCRCSTQELKSIPHFIPSPNNMQFLRQRLASGPQIFSHPLTTNFHYYVPQDLFYILARNYHRSKCFLSHLICISSVTPDTRS